MAINLHSNKQCYHVNILSLSQCWGLQYHPDRLASQSFVFKIREVRQLCHNT